MTLSKILIDLYSDEKKAVYDVLNKSCYVANKKFNDESLFLHTGFKFINHNRTIFYVYVHLETLTTVISPSSKNRVYGDVPQILGLPCLQNQEKYINNIEILGCFFTKLLINSDLNGNDKESFVINKFTEEDCKNFKFSNNALKLADKGEIYIYKSFEIINNGVMIKNLPLHKTFEDIVFQHGNYLEKYDTSKFENRENVQTAEQWYKSEFGDDSSTVWWNTH